MSNEHGVVHTQVKEGNGQAQVSEVDEVYTEYNYSYLGQADVRGRKGVLCYHLVTGR